MNNKPISDDWWNGFIGFQSELIKSIDAKLREVGSCPSGSCRKLSWKAPECSKPLVKWWVVPWVNNPRKNHEVIQVNPVLFLGYFKFPICEKDAQSLESTLQL